MSGRRRGALLAICTSLGVRRWHTARENAISLWFWWFFRIWTTFVIRTTFRTSFGDLDNFWDNFFRIRTTFGMSSEKEFLTWFLLSLDSAKYSSTCFLSTHLWTTDPLTAYSVDLLIHSLWLRLQNINQNTSTQIYPQCDSTLQRFFCGFGSKDRVEFGARGCHCMTLSSREG